MSAGDGKSSVDAKRPEADEQRADQSEVQGEVHASSAKVTQVKDTLRYLDKVVKTLSLFGKGHVNPERAKEEFIQKLEEFLKQWGALTLDLDGSKILCDGAMVMEEQQQKDDFTFRLFQDGVKQLSITAGVTKEELNSFFTILLANYNAGQYAHDDTVTLHWELGPKHIKFAISEGYDETGGDPENAPASTDEYRQVRMALTERRIEPGEPAPAVSVEEERAKIAKFQKLISQGGGLYFSPQDRTRLLEEARKGQPRLIERYIEILYRLAASGPEEEHLKKILAIIGQLFLGLVSGSGLDQASRLVKLIRSFAENAGEQQAGERQRVVDLVLKEISNRDMVVGMLRSLAPKNRGETIDLERAKTILDFLSLLGESTLEFILDHLGEIADPPIRSQVCGIAGVLGRKKVDLFAQKLTGAGGKLALDLLEILKAIGTPEAADAILMVADHPEPEVRLKVIRYADSLVDKDRMKPLLLRGLRDNNERVRSAAIKRLESSEGSDVVEQLKQVIADNDFSYRDKEEKRRIFVVLGTVGGKDTIPFFRECFNQSNPLKRSKIDEVRGLAAYMLGMLDDVDSRGEIEKKAGGKLVSAFFKWSCSQALGMFDGKVAKRQTGRISVPPALAAGFGFDSDSRPSSDSLPPVMAAPSVPPKARSESPAAPQIRVSATPGPEPMPQPVSEPKPEPMPKPAPTATPEPKPAPTAAPEPKPAPTAAPKPEPLPALRMEAPAAALPILPDLPPAPQIEPMAAQEPAPAPGPEAQERPTVDSARRSDDALQDKPGDATEPVTEERTGESQQGDGKAQLDALLAEFILKGK